MIVEAEGSHAALLVDELVGQQQVVVKSLEANFRKVPGLAGATMMGDGRVALDPRRGSHIVRMSRRKEKRNKSQQQAIPRRIAAGRRLAQRASPQERVPDLPPGFGKLRHRDPEGAGDPRLRGAHRIANAPAFIKGVINLRGVIVPILDLRIKFGLSGRVTTSSRWSSS